MNNVPKLEWALQRRRFSARALMLAMVLMAAVLALLQWQQQLDARLAEHGQRLEKARRLAMVAQGPKPQLRPQMSPAASQQVNIQIALLNRDWFALMKELGPKSAKAKLLGMDVNPSTGAVRITGSATSSADANAYAESLQQRAPLRDVRLLLLERKADQVNFEVTAQWID